MGWERINKLSYYYRSVREGGRVRSEYVGAGEVAALAARVDDLNRERREAEQRGWEAEREEAEAEDREIGDWFDEVEALVVVVMGVAGFRRHNRGEWRRRRR